MAGGLGRARLKQATGKGWVRSCSPTGTGGGVGTVGCGGTEVALGVDGSTDVGKGVGRRILNFRNMKATELWKLVLGTASVVTGIPDTSVTILFRAGKPDTVVSSADASTAAVGLVCNTGPGDLTGEASARDFFTLKSRATSSCREQLRLTDPSGVGSGPLQPLSWLSVVAVALAGSAVALVGSAVASGVCASK